MHTSHVVTHSEQMIVIATVASSHTGRDKLGSLAMTIVIATVASSDTSRDVVKLGGLAVLQ